MAAVTAGTPSTAWGAAPVPDATGPFPAGRTRPRPGPPPAADAQAARSARSGLHRATGDEIDVPRVDDPRPDDPRPTRRWAPRHAFADVPPEHTGGLDGPVELDGDGGNDVVPDAAAGASTAAPGAQAPGSGEAATAEGSSDEASARGDADPSGAERAASGVGEGSAGIGSRDEPSAANDSRDEPERSMPGAAEEQSGAPLRAASAWSAFGAGGLSAEDRSQGEPSPDDRSAGAPSRTDDVSASPTVVPLTAASQRGAALDTAAPAHDGTPPAPGATDVQGSDTPDVRTTWSGPTAEPAPDDSITREDARPATDPTDPTDPSVPTGGRSADDDPSDRTDELDHGTVPDLDDDADGPEPVGTGPVPPPWSPARIAPASDPEDCGSAEPVSFAVQQALAARAVQRARGRPDVPDLADDVPVSVPDARDRLLSVLLIDPVTALGATTALDDTRARIDRLGDVLRRRRADLATAVHRLHASGLTGEQIGQLAGLDGDDVREILEEPSGEGSGGR